MGYDLGVIGAGVRLDNRPYLTNINQMQTRTASALHSIEGSFLRVFGTLGVIKLFKDTATESMNFGQALSNVVSIADDLNIEEVRREITGLNSVLGKSTDLTDSFYRAYSAGARGSAEDLADFTGEVAKLSRAIRADQVPTMKAVTKLMNSYGMTVADVAEINDTLFQIVKQGDTTGQEIATTIGLVANSAAVAGVSLDEMGAALAVLTRTMETSRAVVSLNQVITSFLDPTKEAKEVAKGLGIELSASMIKTMGFANAIKLVSERAGDNVEALNLMFGNIRAFRAIASLAGTQAETFQNILGEFGEKGGTALKAFEVQTDNTKTTWTVAMTDMNKAMIRFGDAISPLVEDLSGIISGVSGVVEKMDDWEIKLGLGSIAMSLIITKMQRMSMGAQQVAMASTRATATTAQATTTNAAYTNAVQMQTKALMMNLTVMQRRALVMSQNSIAMHQAAMATHKNSLINLKSVQYFQQATVATGKLTTGMSSMKATSMALGGSMGALNAAMLAIPVAMASWKLGRWIAEVTELDSKVERFYGNLLHGREEIEQQGFILDESLIGGRKGIMKKRLDDLEKQFPKLSGRIQEFRDNLGNVGLTDIKGMNELEAKFREFRNKFTTAEGKPVEIPLTDLLSFESDDEALRTVLAGATEEQIKQFKSLAETLYGEGNLGKLARKDKQIMEIVKLVPDLSKALAMEQARIDFKKQLDMMEHDILTFQTAQQDILAREATGELTEKAAQDEMLTALQQRQKTHTMNIQNLREQQAQIMIDGTKKEKEAVMEALQAELDGYKQTTEQIKAMQEETAKNSPLMKLKEQLKQAGGVQALRESIFKDDKVTVSEGRAFVGTLTKEQRGRLSDLVKVAKERGLEGAEATRVAMRTLNAELRNQMKMGNLNGSKQVELLQEVADAIKQGNGVILFTED